MKFVIAPDKYKGSLTGFEFCNAVEQGLKTVFRDAEIIKKPLADGGDGTIDVVNYYINAEKISVRVNDPLFRSIDTSYLYSEKTQTAYIEMAEASGLKLLKDSERNCMHTTSFGTGELMVDAIKKDVKEIILGIGGSATNDGGMGMANALGFRFLDKNNEELKPVGRNLMSIKKIDSSKVNTKLRDVKVKVACDVSNPFYGKEGAAQVYAAQKGASKEEIEILDHGLRNFSKVINDQYQINVQKIKGAGAAGGMGAAAFVFLNARLTSGIDLIKELADFNNAIEGADWIITGEGKLDTQTLSGKTIDGVVRSAFQKRISVAALCGSVNITEEERTEMGLSYVVGISEGYTDLEEAFKHSYSNLVKESRVFAKKINGG